MSFNPQSFQQQQYQNQFQQQQQFDQMKAFNDLQMREGMKLFQGTTLKCFKLCATNFRFGELDNTEKDCVKNCTNKVLSYNQVVGGVFQKQQSSFM